MAFLKENLNNKKILVTAGPTHESIDPVRYISNYSSGKMGYAIANTLANYEAEVILISGPVNIQLEHPSVQLIKVKSADEMYKESIKYFPDTDAAILCAAVADYTPEIVSKEKIKRSDKMVLKLKPTKDIAAALGKIKTKNQILIGFALETMNEKQNALDKLKKKNLDFIVLNSLRDEGAGFQKDTNKITIIDHDGIETRYEMKDKNMVAVDIVEKLMSYY